MPVELAADAIDWRDWLRPGDRIVVSQAGAEPTTLTQTLVQQRAGLGRPQLFVGPILAPVLRPEHGDHLDFLSYCGTAANRCFVDAGVMQIQPVHFTDLLRNFRTGLFGCDVALVLLAETGGRFNTGLANDHVIEAARRARFIIAEVSDQLPWTEGADWPADLTPDVIVRTSRSGVALPKAKGTGVEARIAAHVASLVPDGATLEIGIGSLSGQVIAALASHRDLGLHSGVIGDDLVDLIEAGVLTNARKPIDTGVSVAGMLFGGQRTMDFAHRNPQLRLAPSTYTHNPAVAALLPDFMAINGAIEVDLTGQVNSEVAGGRYIGAIGGQVDFARCAQASTGGRSIIMVPSTARNGQLSSIVPQLGSVVTLGRADADTVITEWGIAELRGQTIAERIRRMVAIAHPDFREELDRASHALLKTA